MPPAPPIQWYACEGEDKAAGDTGELVNRNCAKPDNTDHCSLSDTECSVDTDCPSGESCYAAGTHTECGFIYAGTCANYHPAFQDPFACQDFDATGLFYSQCHRESEREHLADAATDQVITTYVEAVE